MRRMIAIVSTLVLAGAMSATGVQASSPPPVDQSTLQPPLNPNFTYRCLRDHGGIVCHGTFDTVYENQPIGLFCDGREIYDTGNGHERLTRWHLPDGRATRTFVTLDYEDHYTLSPTGGGRTANGVGHWIRTYTYPDPGVKDTRVFTELGLIQRIRDDHNHVFWLDQGVVRYVPGHEFETPAWTIGRIDTRNDEVAAEARLCAALS